MIVYKITFPSGHFYIGRTFNIENRMAQHYANKDSGISDYILKHCACSKDLLKLSDVLYDGDEYKIFEAIEISKSIGHKLSLNRQSVDLDVVNIVCLTNNISKVELADKLNISYQDLSRISRYNPEYLKKCEDEYNALAVAIHVLKLRKPSQIAGAAMERYR